MPGLSPKFKQGGPLTFQVFVATKGGQLVARGAGGNSNLVGPAGANEPNCLGVATTDALPVGTDTSFVPVGGFFSGFDGTAPDENVAVGRHGVWEITASTDINFGDKVKCGANGTVAVWVKGTDAVDLIVGEQVLMGGTVNGGIAWIDLSLS